MTAKVVKQDSIYWLNNVFQAAEKPILAKIKFVLNVHQMTHVNFVQIFNNVPSA